MRMFMASMVVASVALTGPAALAQQSDKPTIEPRAIGLTPIEPARPSGEKAAAPASTPQSPADRLRELDRLRRDGVITQEEFDSKKKEILKSM